MFPPIITGAGLSALRPASVLSRLRPVRLDAVARKLRDFGLRARVLTMIQTHFPNDWSGNWSADTFWFENYCEFLRHAEAADWFEVNWDLLQAYETAWMETGDDDCTGYDVLVDYADGGIPLFCFGFGPTMPEAEWDEPADLHEYPALEMLRALAFGPEGGRFRSENVDEILARVCGQTNLNELDIYEVQRNLERACRRMKPPWKWLAEMADFACDRSGNFILDTTVDQHKPWPHQWTWGKDLERVKAEWQRAKPVVERFREFVEKVNSDEDLELIAWMAAGNRRKRRR